jgi:hypothetical protein
MTPEQRKKFDAQAQERMDDKQRLFEHLKYNMNSDKPGMVPVVFVRSLVSVPCPLSVSPVLSSLLLGMKIDGSLGCAVG